MKIALLLALLTAGEGAGGQVRGQPGQSVTLPCSYDIRKHGALSVCWNRGEIPTSKCNDQIISTDGRTSPSPSAPGRYRLLGALGDGDVSLTILNVTEADAGRYGCRVEIPGWWNDDKHHFDLAIERAPQTTTTTAVDTQTPTPTQQTPGQMTVTGSDSGRTSSSSSITAEMRRKGSSSVSVALVGFLCALIVLVTAGAVVLISKKWRRFNKMPQQQQRVTTSGPVRSSLSNLQLQSRSSAMENIYQIDEGVEGGEYEYCP